MHTQDTSRHADSLDYFTISFYNFVKRKLERRLLQLEDIYIHPHALKHGLTEDAIVYAWNNF
ncbi:MAG: hypothetical protein RR794_00930, partial [Raoultibacter sp.]